MRTKTKMALWALILLMSACKAEPNAKVVKQEVLNIHDKLMIDGEKVVKNKMKLDTLLLSMKLHRASGASTQNINTLIEKLNKADEMMMDWMHFFNNDFKGKNEREDLNYYKSQMVKIRMVEDFYIKVIHDSDSVLKIYNINPPVNMSNHKN